MAKPMSKASVAGKKGHVTRVINECNNIVDADLLDEVKLELAIGQLERKWDNYITAFDVYETEQLVDKDEKLFQPELEAHAAFELTYFDKLSSYKKALVGVQQARVGAGSGQPNGGGTAVRYRTPKLPPMPLLKFDGNILEWQGFWENFSSLVGKQTDLDENQKLNYLRSCLVGQASDLVSGYQATRSTYGEAVAALKNRYAHEDTVRQTLCYQLLDMKPPSYNHKELSKYLDDFRAIMRNLTKYVSTVEESKWLLGEMFLRKAPKEIHQLLFTKLSKNYYTLAEVEAGLEDAILQLGRNDKLSESTVASEATKNSGYKFTKNKPPFMARDSNLPKQSAVGTYQVKTRQNPKDPICTLCNGPHYNTNCSQYVSVKSRMERLKNLKCCESCLRSGHNFSDCTARLRPCFNCSGTHHTALCPSRTVNSSRSTAMDYGKKFDGATRQFSGVLTAEESKANPVVTQTTVGSNPNSNINQGRTAMANASHINECEISISTAALPTATMQVTNPKSGESRRIRIFCDQGSQCTFIRSTVVQELDLQMVGSIKIEVSGFIGTRKAAYYNVVKPLVRIGNQQKRVKAVVLDQLLADIQTPGLAKAAETLRRTNIRLADKHIISDRVSDIDMIIGSDYYGDFVHEITTRENIRLCKTSGGYMIYGPVPHSPSNEGEILTAVVARVTAEVDPSQLSDYVHEECVPIHKLWDLDTIGIDETKPPPEDTLSYQTFLDSIQYENGQYWVRLPWKVNRPRLPHNYAVALGQLKQLRLSLSKRGRDLDIYHELIREQLENHFIEIVPKARVEENCHYLPHHAVKKDSLTTPLRIVFNCSSKRNGNASLNDCLMSGPSLTSKLGDILLRFRTNKLAYMADISKAFLRVGLQSVDRDHTRFLWYENPEKEDTPLVTYRFTSVLFGATSSPFLLQATLDTHLRSSLNPYKEVIRNSFYVDNFQGTTSDHKELIDIYENANSELLKANMPLRMWVSNDLILKERIEKDYPEYKVPDSTKVLGINWNVETDGLSIKSPMIVDKDKLSKRKLLSNISSVFDPLGLISPVTIRGRMLVREAWRLKGSWDEELPTSFCDDWLKLEEEFHQVSELKFPRMVASSGRDCHLHVFCDASAHAYGAVAYLCTDKGSNILTSKARVSPMKSRTIPQLELTALHVGTKLAHYVTTVLTDLNIAGVSIWSDNEAALQWLRNDNCKMPYVMNRVSEIREISGSYQFLHVPTKENPADLLSRGTNIHGLKDNKLWFHGPFWLVQPGNWPIQKEQIVSVNIAKAEATFALLLQPTGSQEAEGASVALTADLLFDASRFSSLNKILNITNYIFKFIERCSPNFPLPNGLYYWLKVVQAECYALELKALNEGNTNSRKTPPRVRMLGLYLDPASGLIRCRGRLHNSSLPDNTKFPILLPCESWLTSLILREHHHKSLHGGVADTLAALRERYWLPRGRQIIKTFLRKCKVCRTVEGRPIRYPGPPPLPAARVSDGADIQPFHTVGVDYSGAITITNTSDGLPTKFYICLFTCTRTRAVHLELARDMSTQTFINILRRFIARRSCPNLIISDNGTNFRGTAKFLEGLSGEPIVQNYLKSHSISWKFIPPRAPWHGGFYERLIGVVKTCLRKVLYRRKISEDELHTILTEVEMRVNNRPLTYIDNDVDHLNILTPSHLLYGRRLDSLPMQVTNYEEDPDYLGTHELNNRYSYLGRVLKHWETLWGKEYLTSLREKYYGAQPPSPQNLLKVGDIVLVEAEGSRNWWPLGRITNIYPDAAGTVRVAEVYSKGTSSLRTLDKLIPLEISSSAVEAPVVELGEVSTRPKRRTAKIADDVRKVLVRDNLL